MRMLLSLARSRRFVTSSRDGTYDVELNEKVNEKGTEHTEQDNQEPEDQSDAPASTENKQSSV